MIIKCLIMSDKCQFLSEGFSIRGVRVPVLRELKTYLEVNCLRLTSHFTIAIRTEKMNVLAMIL